MVSVIIPLYNAEQHIERCVFSLIHQTVKDIEILIINDGSRDRSLLLAEKIAETDRRVKVITQENKGVSAARNLGIKHAQGEAICFVDADDYVEERYVEKMYAVWNEETLVACNFVHNDSTKKVLPCALDAQLSDDRVSDFLTGELGREIAFSCWNKMFSAKLLHRHDIIFPENIRIGEDMIFVLRYLSCSQRIRYVDEGLYHYCIYNFSVMNAKVRDYFIDYCDTIRALKRTELNGWPLCDETLSYWAQDVLTVIFNNQFFGMISYREFSRDYLFYKQSPLFQYAAMSRKNPNRKRAVLSFALRTRCKFFLFALIKLNHMLIR